MATEAKVFLALFSSGHEEISLIFVSLHKSSFINPFSSAREAKSAYRLGFAAELHALAVVSGGGGSIAVVVIDLVPFWFIMRVDIN